jgi:hypothetical protein
VRLVPLLLWRCMRGGPLAYTTDASNQGADCINFSIRRSLSLQGQLGLLCCCCSTYMMVWRVLSLHGRAGVGDRDGHTVAVTSCLCKLTVYYYRRSQGLRLRRMVSVGKDDRVAWGHGRFRLCGCERRSRSYRFW